MAHVVVTFTEEERKLIITQARAAELGGQSHLRPEGERSATLGTDQLTGQIGQAALHKWLYGNLRRYQLERQRQNRTPWNGDGGHDVDGLKVDVKCSLLREGADPEGYHLWVRLPEAHDGWVYVLALVPQDKRGTCWLMGWAYTSEMRIDAEGRLERLARDLHPLPAWR